MLASASAFALDESVMCTAEYAPVCGEIPRMCVTAPCESPRETFGNACMARAAGATEVTPGECHGVDE